MASLDPAKVSDLATQAVRRTANAAAVVSALWLSIDQSLASDGIEHLTMALVVPLFRAYRAKFRGAITQIGAMLEDYICADSIPAVIDLTHPNVANVRHRLQHGQERVDPGTMTSVSADIARMGNLSPTTKRPLYPAPDTQYLPMSRGATD